MAKPTGDPHDPGDIIELTDIIEHGPGAPKADAAAGGVDLSFERELEDLFADTPGDAAAKDGPLPDLEDLHLPESGSPAKQGEPDIDLEGLDDLLAAAEQSPPSPAGDLPELPDDFSDDLFDKPLDGETSLSEVSLEGLPRLDSAPQQETVPAGALGARLDALEASFAGLSDSLPQTCRNMIDDSLAAFRNELGQNAPDLSSLESSLKDALVGDLETRLAEAAAENQARLAALRDDISRGLPDIAGLEAALAARADEAAQAADARLAGLEAELAQLRQAVSAQEDDGAASAAQDAARLASDLTDLSAQVAALKESAPDAAALAETVRDQVLAQAPAAQDFGPELGLLRADLDALRHQVAALPDTTSEPAEMTRALDELAGRVAGLETAFAGLPAEPVAKPDLEERFAALKAQLTADMEKAVPHAAARIIREEIQALLAQDME